MHINLIFTRNSETYGLPQDNRHCCGGLARHNPGSFASPGHQVTGTQIYAS
jgi:hypothetical protein